MSSESPMQPAGWYYAQGDPPGTQRYWDGNAWQGDPQPVGDAAAGIYASAGSGSQLAEPGSRVGARLIDFLVWIAIALVPGIISLVTTGGSTVIGNLVSLVGISAYEIGMTGTSGATLGKRALGLKIVKADGSPLDLSTAAIRFSPYIVINLISQMSPTLGIVGGLLLLGVGLVSLVLLFSDDRHRTIWDQLAKTEVWSTR